jgi:hypothetical protein
MADEFANVFNQSNPVSRWPIAVASGTALALLPRGILCAATGNITIEDGNGVAMTLTAPPVGVALMVRPFKVTAVTGTFHLLY